MLTTEAKSLETGSDAKTRELLAALARITAIEAALCGPIALVCWLSLRKEDGTLRDELTGKQIEANGAALTRAHA